MGDSERVEVVLTRFLQQSQQLRQLYAALMDLEKVYDNIYQRAMRDVIMIYGEGEGLQEGIEAFYKMDV